MQSWYIYLFNSKKVEYMIVEFNEDQKTAKLKLSAEELLEKLQNDKENALDSPDPAISPSPSDILNDLFIDYILIRSNIKQFPFHLAPRICSVYDRGNSGTTIRPSNGQF